VWYVGLTAASGGFVSGNHAGLAYNDWPFMGYPNFIPNDWCVSVCAYVCVCVWSVIGYPNLMRKE